MPKKLELTINMTDHSICLSRSKSFAEPIFAFVSPPKDGKMKAITDMTYCRESICEFVRQDIRGVSNYNINLNRLHIVIHRRVVSYNKAVKGLKVFQNEVYAGKTMVNAIEKHYGWPLTKVYPVKLPKSQRNVPINNGYYYIVASKRWMKAPAMLSMFLLLFRIATGDERFGFRKKIRSVKSLFKVLSDAAAVSSVHEFAYFREHGPRWQVVLDNYRKLFGQRTIEDLYQPGGKNNYYFSEGINTLCDEDSKDPTLAGQFEDLVEKRGV